jgi:hypothetical protein
MFDLINRRQLTLSFGHRTFQFNNENPISLTKNTFFTYTFRRNFMKIYDSRFVELRYEGEISNALQINAGVNYAKRSQLDNRFGTSLFFKDSRDFSSNLPQSFFGLNSAFGNHQALISDMEFDYTPGMKVIRYPNRKIKLGSDWPTFNAHIRRGFAIDDQSPDFTLLQLGVKGIQSLKAGGSFTYYLNGGSFITSEKTYFMDIKHFLGNQTNLGNINRYDRQFFLLDYYGYSTIGDFAQAHMEYNSGGWILDRIPGVRKLKLHLIFSYKVLDPAVNNSSMPLYQEFAIGIDRLGIGDFRLFRLDFVLQRFNKDSTCFGLVFGSRI